MLRVVVMVVSGFFVGMFVVAGGYNSRVVDRFVVTMMLVEVGHANQEEHGQQTDQYSRHGPIQRRQMASGMRQHVQQGDT